MRDRFSHTRRSRFLLRISLENKAQVATHPTILAFCIETNLKIEVSVLMAIAN
ncbi:hypothetical protein [Aliterella atlantica]|uniref:hypothetical protein n=1 Tax=Aliterella atlantica TaxID=1827278 RepID=UPI001364B02C|nr:hypothetical protein [Aliterella atlantica]